MQYFCSLLYLKQCELGDEKGQVKHIYHKYHYVSSITFVLDLALEIRMSTDY